MSSQVILEGSDSDDGRYGNYTTINAPVENNIKFKNYSGTFEYEFDRATFTSVTSFVKYEQASISDQTAGFAGVIDEFVLGNPVGTTTSVILNKKPESKKLVHEMRLTSEESDTFEWIVGAYFTKEDTFDDQGVEIVPVAVVGVAELVSKYKEYAVFGNATYYITSNFDVTYGLRLSNNSLDLTIDQAGALLGKPPEIEKTVLPHASQTVDTHMLAFRYRPSDDMSVYVKAASGFRPSSGNFPLADIVSGDPIAPVVLAADTLWSYDLGVKGNLADGMFTYDVAVWQSDWKNFQSSIFNGVATSSRN
ncbi:MAG: TonB-dependent receptor, partial [Emcibacteraceae bacterium]|nr:TonB-dependent receptor [Emcibacteraceae bacterium]